MVLPEMIWVQSAIILAEELNFSRAAERLGVHQSALSRDIAKLEGLLDVLLFERDHRKVELTAAGRKFVADARPGVELIERGMVSARAASDASGWLRWFARFICRSVRACESIGQAVTLTSLHTTSSPERSISPLPPAFRMRRRSHFSNLRSIPSTLPCRGVILWLAVVNCEFRTCTIASGPCSQSK